MSSRSDAPADRSTGRAGDAPRIRGLDYRFEQPELLERALTHRSCGNPHNERLEFLGDAVLNCVVAELLFHRHADVAEGDLTRMRARLVRGRTLAGIARDLALGDHLRLGPGELKSGGFLRDSILADALEAVIGAVFIDGGYEVARGLVGRLMRSRIRELPDAESLKDAKTRLQELLQGRGQALPSYQVIEESGADHQRSFTVVCRIPGAAGAAAGCYEGRAPSRRRAEQAAAARALEALSGSGDGS